MSPRHEQAVLLARLAKLEEDPPSAFEPIVKTRCICPNGGRPDEDGFIAYSPSCLMPGHGVRTKYVSVPDLSIDVRKVG